MAKTENKIIEDILKTTNDIKEQFPELSRYIEEMPVTIPDAVNPEITIENLSTYNESLNALVAKYAKSHSKK